jgi:hypothetical protein
MSMQSAYWRFFNFLARRVVAVAFAVIGSLMALVALPSLLHPKSTILVNGQPEHDLFYRVVAFLMRRLWLLSECLCIERRRLSHLGARSVKPNIPLVPTRRRGAFARGRVPPILLAGSLGRVLGGAVGWWFVHRRREPNKPIHATCEDARA